MITKRNASDYPFVSYVTEEDDVSTSCAAQEYMDGVLQYWSQQANLDIHNITDIMASDDMDMDAETCSSGTACPDTITPTLIPQLQDYQKHLLALEYQNNQRVVIARQRQTQAKKAQSLRDQRNIAARKTHTEEQPPMERYKSYLLAVQSQSDERLIQVRDQEAQREAHERKRQLDHILDMRRKDSGIYCDSVDMDYDKDGLHAENGEDATPGSRRHSRIDTWVEAQAQRRQEFVSSKKPGKTVEAKVPQVAIDHIFSDFQCQLTGLERFRAQSESRVDHGAEIC